MDQCALRPSSPPSLSPILSLKSPSFPTFFHAPRSCLSVSSLLQPQRQVLLSVHNEVRGSFSGRVNPFLPRPCVQVVGITFDTDKSRQTVRSVKEDSGKLSDSKVLRTLLWNRTPLMSIFFVIVSLIISAGVVCSQVYAASQVYASQSIKTSALGLRVAHFLRTSGWTDEVIVLVMAMLPVLELRGAIPIGYWMQLDPMKLSILAVLGNMVPVPVILLYLEKLAKFLANKGPRLKHLFDSLFEATRKKAGPIQEFEWLGLMLFVAVPFPGTGAWTGAMAASVLGMPFWDAMSANFFGVIIAGLLVNLLVNLGLRYAVIVGVALFIASTFMWGILRRMFPNRN
eukprot:c20470_g1_i1 orf=411-1436(-)